MKNKITIILIILSISLNIYLAISSVNELEEEYLKGSKSGYNLAYDIAYWKATHVNYSDKTFERFSGNIYSIELYDVINFTKKIGYYSGDEFHPYVISVYEAKLDLSGFMLDKSTLSPYVNTNGVRLFDFRFCDNDVIKEPGNYEFWYLYDNIMFVTHWEKLD